MSLLGKPWLSNQISLQAVSLFFKNQFFRTQDKGACVHDFVRGLCYSLHSSHGFSIRRETISDSNWTDWSTIQGVIPRVKLKLLLPELQQILKFLICLFENFF